MGDKSAIEWTDATWNPVTGCSKVSPGCANCYAETMAMTRLAGREGYPGLPWTPENAAENVVLRPERLAMPLKWRRPRMVFVNSMSDLFHELVPSDYIDRVFGIMGQASRHTFQVLTKRPDRMRRYLRSRHIAERGPYPPLPNVWLGTSIENNRWVSRADELRATPATIRFLSCEPLLGPLPDLDLTGIDWVIVGGESGPGARPMHSDWVREIRAKCEAAGAAFFFKQWGAWARGTDLSGFSGPVEVVRIDGKHGPWTEWERAAHEFSGSPGLLRPEAVRRAGKHAAGRELDGRTWDAMPVPEVALSTLGDQP